MFPGAGRLTIDDFTISSSTFRWNIPPLVETVPVLSLKRPSHVRATEVVASVNNQPVRNVTTDIESGPKVMVYGDSFAEASLLSYFDQSFKSTMFVPSNHSPFPADLITKHRPDLVIFQLVERYLARGLTPASALKPVGVPGEAPSPAAP